MNAFFSTVLEMSGKACVVIAAVLLARLILARAPKKYSYFLWSLVALRLCVPFSISTGFSIFAKMLKPVLILNGTQSLNATKDHKK